MSFMQSGESKDTLSYLEGCNKNTRDKTEHVQNSPPINAAQPTHTNYPVEGREPAYIW